MFETKYILVDALYDNPGIELDTYTFDSFKERWKKSDCHSATCTYELLPESFKAEYYDPDLGWPDERGHDHIQILKENKTKPLQIVACVRANDLHLCTMPCSDRKTAHNLFDTILQTFSTKIGCEQFFAEFISRGIGQLRSRMLVKFHLNNL